MEGNNSIEVAFCEEKRENDLMLAGQARGIDSWQLYAVICLYIVGLSV